MKRFVMLLAATLTLASCTDYKALYNSIVKEISDEAYNGRSV